MEKLNQRNWQYLADWKEINKDKVYKKHPPVAFPDFECIRIRTLHLKIDQYLFAPKLTILEALGVRVNLYSMVIVNNKEHVKLLLEAPTNDRQSRYRPESTQKYAPILLLNDHEKRNFANEAGEFGKLWVRKYMPKEIQKAGEGYEFKV